MKHIILPTDFSSNAENAANYILQLNKFIKGELHLFHSYVIPVFATDVPVTVPDITDLKEESLKLMHKLKANLQRQNPDSSSEIHISVSAGYPEEEIPSFSVKKRADLVVMGTKGVTGLKEVFFGTNTARVIGKLNCPLLVVPENAKFKGLKKIVFATNYAENDVENISEVIEFAKLFLAEVVLLHISSGDQSKPFEFNSLETFCQKLRESTGYDSLKYKLLDNPEVEEGINFYLDEIKADMIVMTNRHRSLFQKLFEKSITKKMAYHTHIPLMVFHVKELGDSLQ